METRTLLIDLTDGLDPPSWLNSIGRVTKDPDASYNSIIFASNSEDMLNFIRDNIEDIAAPSAYLVLDYSNKPLFMIDKTNEVPLVRICLRSSSLQQEITIEFLNGHFYKSKGLSGASLKLPKCPDLSTERSVLPPLLSKDGLTDYPTKGENKPIHFKNSQFKLFPLKTALQLAQKHPKAWCSGGNHFGNKAFNYWIRTMKALEDKQPIPVDCQRWIKKREGYIARHTKDFRLAGVVAMIKWAGFVDGPNGVGNGAVDGSSLKYMLDLFKDEK